MGLVCPSSDLKTCLLKLVAHFLPPPPRTRFPSLCFYSIFVFLDFFPFSFFLLITPLCDLISKEIFLCKFRYWYISVHTTEEWGNSWKSWFVGIAKGKWFRWRWQYWGIQSWGRITNIKCHLLDDFSCREPSKLCLDIFWNGVNKKCLTAPLFSVVRQSIIFADPMHGKVEGLCQQEKGSASRKRGVVVVGQGKGVLCSAQLD